MMGKEELAGEILERVELLRGEGAGKAEKPGSPSDR
jgi:phosphopantothenoylcysteine decarboxylase/phosphopantothenate--cysteine ligase